MSFRSQLTCFLTTESKLMLHRWRIGFLFRFIRTTHDVILVVFTFCITNRWVSHTEQNKWRLNRGYTCFLTTESKLMLHRWRIGFLFRFIRTTHDVILVVFTFCITNRWVSHTEQNKWRLNRGYTCFLTTEIWETVWYSRNRVYHR